MLPSMLAGMDSPTNHILATQTEIWNRRTKKRKLRANSKYESTKQIPEYSEHITVVYNLKYHLEMIKSMTVGGT
jgi:hypothetical protein